MNNRTAEEQPLTNSRISLTEDAWYRPDAACRPLQKTG